MLDQTIQSPASGLTDRTSPLGLASETATKMQYQLTWELKTASYHQFSYLTAQVSQEDWGRSPLSDIIESNLQFLNARPAMGNS